MDQLQIIQNRIYEFRGQKVMLDCDLAEMYGVQTKVLSGCQTKYRTFSF